MLSIIIIIMIIIAKNLQVWQVVMTVGIKFETAVITCTHHRSLCIQPQVCSTVNTAVVTALLDDFHQALSVQQHKNFLASYNPVCIAEKFRKFHQCIKVTISVFQSLT